MIRKIIKINEALCNGCGLCVDACHEAAIGLVDGKAKLLRDDYCDGLGNCLPACPVNAIAFEEREALDYNEEEVMKNMQNKNKQELPNNKKANEVHHGCPGTAMRELKRQAATVLNETLQTKEVLTSETKENTPVVSELMQWPVQMKLVPANAPYFANADLLIAADCTAFAYGDFHRFMKNKITIIGCPKLDDTDYSEKLSQILMMNEIKSITVIRMEVPCCGGIVNAVKTAMRNSGEMIPWKVITIGTDGTIRSEI